MRFSLALAVGLPLLAALGCGQTEIEDIKDIVTAPVHEKAEIEGRDAIIDSGPKREAEWVVAKVIEVARTSRRSL